MTEAGTALKTDSPDTTQPAQTVQQEALFRHASARPRRTWGLRFVDILLYPIINNISVFALSVWMTYMSKHGADVQDGKLVFGKVGEFIHQRTKPVKAVFRKLGVKNETSVNDYTTVFFSFFDGTLFAPLIKLLEDRREKIAYWVDSRLGTTHPDMSVYDAEPKQTWGSVVEGRLLTSAIVVPTAIVLDKKGLNDKMFNGWGNKLSHWIEETPRVRNLFSKKLILPKLSNIIVFEAFYTSVCTAGLYFISRFIARKHTPLPESPQAQPAPLVRPEQFGVPADTLAPKQPAATPPLAPVADMADKPRPDVAQVAHRERLEPAHAQHVSA